MRKRVILTGASGFVGTDVIREMKDHYDIVGIGRSFKEIRNEPHIHYITGDLLTLTSEEVLSPFPSKSAEFFIHAAGQVHTAQTAQNRELFLRNNIKATEAALRIAISTGVCKFIYISSVVVYNGNSSDIYEQTKKASEDIVIETCTKHALPYVIIRPVIVYGKTGSTGYIADVLRQMRSGYIFLPNRGKKVQYMIYVKNLSCIIQQAVSSSEYDNSVLVARDNEILKLRDVYNILRRYAGVSCRMIVIPTTLVKASIIAINIVQKIGLLKSIKVRSIRNLNVQVQYPLSHSNEILLSKLPFTINEGLALAVGGKLEAKKYD